MKLKKKIFSGLVTAAVIAGVLYSTDIFSGKQTAESYIEFYNQAGDKKIQSVEILEDKIVYVKKDSSEKFKTQNPQSPLLKEYLLKNDIEVSEEKNIDAIVSNILDIIFYIIFFGIIFIVFRKFISPNTFKIVRKTGKTFNDIIGMEKLKSSMNQIVDMMKNPSGYAHKGIRMPKGILLEGSPGNGKTLFARALAGEAKVNFIPAKATDFESMFMAIGPMKVKLLFRKARKNTPCIVFIDEFDGIGTRRNYSGSAIETENTRIVTALLNELDGFDQNEGVLVIAATNSIKALDEALIRPGRFDAKYTVPSPDEKMRMELFTMYTKNKKLSGDCNGKIFADLSKGFSCAKIESVINKAVMISVQEGRDCFGIEEIKSAISEVDGL